MCRLLTWYDLGLQGMRRGIKSDHPWSCSRISSGYPNRPDSQSGEISLSNCIKGDSWGDWDTYAQHASGVVLVISKASNADMTPVVV